MRQCDSAQRSPWLPLGHTATGHHHHNAEDVVTGSPDCLLQRSEVFLDAIHMVGELLRHELELVSLRCVRLREESVQR